jgi:hypothetical protein
MNAAHHGNLFHVIDIIINPGTDFDHPAEDVLKVILSSLLTKVDEFTPPETQSP